VLELKTYEEKEKIMHTDNPRILHWYGPHFAAYGFQRVKAQGSGSRNVFYINKISF